MLIGIGNDLLDSFRDWVNEEIESLDQKEVRTRKLLQQAEHKVIDLVAERDDWDDTPDGRNLQSLKRKMNYRAKKLKELGAIIKVATSTSSNNTDSPAATDDTFLDEVGISWR